MPSARERQAFEKCQLANNPQFTNSYMATLAQLCALTRERAQVIGEVESLSKMDTHISYGDPRCHPYRGALRGDSSFEAVVAAFAAKQ